VPLLGRPDASFSEAIFFSATPVRHQAKTKKSTNAHKLHRRGKDKRRQRQRHEFIFRDDIPVQAMHQLWSGNSTPAVNKRTQH
jgi:hypothetical protein